MLHLNLRRLGPPFALLVLASCAGSVEVLDSESSNSSHSQGPEDLVHDPEVAERPVDNQNGSGGLDSGIGDRPPGEGSEQCPVGYACEEGKREFVGCPTGAQNLGESPSTPVCKRRVIQVATGNSHSCALRIDGTVDCWGNNDDGQLGNGGTAVTLAPTTVAGLPRAISISAGGAHTCALIEDGTAFCWGDNAKGQLGDGTDSPSSSPVQVLDIDDAIALDVGAKHSCALKGDGAALCWGDNSLGQLGNDDVEQSSSPFPVSADVSFESISAGGSLTCAMEDPDTLWCWGSEYRRRLSPHSSDAWKNVRSMSAGKSGSCIVTGEHDVACLDPDFDEYSWYWHPEVDNAAAVVGTGSSGCALLNDGRVECWGDMGNGSESEDQKPLVDVLQIDMGEEHACAVRSDGGVSCWGANSRGQVLGLDPTGLSDRPLADLGVVGVKQLSVGWKSNCATLEGGEVYCWGKLHSAYVGHNDVSNHFSVAHPVSRLDPVVMVSAGRVHQCAVEAGGTVKCWGSNTYGQLGDGTHMASDFPVTVLGIDQAIEVVAGDAHSCALLADQSIKCWGGSEARHVEPIAVSGLSAFTEVSAKAKKTCGLTTTGSFECWEQNIGLDGEPSGLETFITSSMPKHLAMGWDHGCLLDEGGQVSCWGENNRGQLGDGTKESRLTLAPVSGIGTATSLAVGLDHTCASLDDGSALCWGFNESGQLGDGTTDDSVVPVNTSLTETVSSVAAGTAHSCAVIGAEKTVTCWGIEHGVYDQGRLGTPPRARFGPTHVRW